MKKLIFIFLFITGIMYAQRVDRLDVSNWTRNSDGSITFNGNMTVNSFLEILSNLSVGGDITISGNMSTDTLTFSNFPQLTDSLVSRKNETLAQVLQIADGDSVTNVYGQVRFHRGVTLDSSTVVFADTGFVLTDSVITQSNMQDQTKTLSAITDVPDYLGQPATYDGNRYISTSVTGNSKWTRLKTDKYPFTEASMGKTGAYAIDTIAAFIKDVYLEGAKNDALTYSFSGIRRNYSGGGVKWAIVLYSADGSPGSITAVASFATDTDPEGGADSITVHTLSEYDDSGISGKIAVDWSKIRENYNYNSMYAYQASDGYILRDEVWDKNSSTFARIYDNDYNIDTLNTDVEAIYDTLDYYVNSTASGVFTGYYMPDTQYVHTNGEAEYVGDNYYGQYGVGTVEQMTKSVVFNRIRAKFYGTSSVNALRFKIYKKSTEWTSGDLSDLTLLDSVNISSNVNTNSSDYQQIDLNETVRVASGEWLYVLCGSATQSIRLRRWTSDSSPSRESIKFSTNSSPFENSWSTGSSSYLTTPTKLILVDRSAVDGINTTAFDDNLTNFIGSRADSTNPVRLILPDTLWASDSDSTQINIYFDNIVLVPDIEDYYFDVVCDSGTHYEKRWAFTPVTTGTFNWTVKVYNWDGDKLAEDSCKITVASSALSAGKKIMMIGNSLTDANIYPAEVFNMANDSLTFIGTQDSGTDSPNEGYSGRSWVWFQSNASSPFIKSGVIDIDAYFTDNSLDEPDLITIGLGTNDVFASTDDDIDADLDDYLADADELIDSLKADISGVEIGVMMQVPPSASQDAFGDDYDSGATRWQFRRNIHRYVERVKSHFDGVAQVSLIPVYMGLDTEHNMQTTTSEYNSRNSDTYTMQNNGVHPDTSGYYQMADFIYGWVVNK